MLYFDLVNSYINTYVALSAAYLIFVMSTAQPVGQPEISRMSLSECSVEGGDCLFIIGKNFKNRGTSVLFQKLDGPDENLVWQAEAEIEQEYFQPVRTLRDLYHIVKSL